LQNFNSTLFQNALPPGMLQQMQRQMRSGGGIQEMMKTLMQSQGGDQMDMEEMQRMMSQAGGLGGLGGLGGGMPNMGDMFKMMGMGRGGGAR
jgi:signal recognition particle subunit SRP54